MGIRIATQGGSQQIFSGDDQTVARLGKLQPPQKPRQPGSAIGTLRDFQLKKYPIPAGRYA